jgi:hypothetical protein
MLILPYFALVQNVGDPFTSLDNNWYREHRANDLIIAKECVASERVDQCVPSRGQFSRVSVSTRSTATSLIFSQRARTGFIEQPSEAHGHKTDAPFAHGLNRCRELASDRRVAQSLGAGQHDAIAHRQGLR